ncbi:MAG TPA: hypothetical protein VFQ15_00575, partial [Jiangellaceae bacterium]|nr:hypothetical protein [Jiangellaceae bacterium]
MNVGDCLTIDFQNLLAPAVATGQIATRSAGISVLGMELVNAITDDGSNVGRNATTADSTAGLVLPNQSIEYELYAEREGAYQLYSPSDTVSVEGIGVLAHGLFGAVNVEPTGAEWYRSQVTRDDLELANPAEPFQDIDANGTWDAAVEGEPFVDADADSQWDLGEEFTDSNLNGSWDGPVDAEPLIDTNGDGRWNDHPATSDGHPILDYDALYPPEHRLAGTPILNMLQPLPELDVNGNPKLEIVHSDLTAVITGPGRGGFDNWYVPNATYPNRNQPFREFTVVFHDEAAMVQAFPEVFADPAFAFTLHGVRDGKAINYGTGGIAAEVLANRLGVGPSKDCAECKLEEFFLTSWALGDPAQVVDVPADQVTEASGPATKVFYPDDPSNVLHSYINDHTKIRNIHVGKEHHIFHLHSHQWLQTADDDNSNYLDSQAIGPGSTYSYEIAYGGSGNRNKTPGDAIFHCHFYPHFAQGMWALWRNHDVFQWGTKYVDGAPVTGALPDGEIADGTPTPGVVPLPTLAMAPMAADADIVGGQVDIAGSAEGEPDGIPDHVQGWPAPSHNPGFPYYIPGIAGHRPPTPPLDMTDPEDIDPVTGQAKPGVTPRVYDGGLPRHVISGGEASMPGPDGTYVPDGLVTPTDFGKVLERASATYVPEAGTGAEQQAMAFHAQLRHDSFRPDGGAALGPDGYETNGLAPFPGAPYAQPCRADDGSLLTTAPQRVYKGADIQLDMKLNKLGWHFPQARMLALWEDVGPMLGGKVAPQPFVMRANSGDCITYYHTNLVPGYYEQDAYQVRTPTDIIGQHIHLVKFDVTSSDGSGNGFNYEDGTFSPDEVRERINAIKADGCGGAVCPVAKPHPFFGPGPNNTWMGARTTIQQWWADPVVNNQGVDRGLGNVYTHDHYGPSTHQQTGLYATLIIEPSRSLWRDSETGKCFGDTGLVGRAVPAVADGGCVPVTGRKDGGPTSWRADVLTAEDAPTTPAIVTSNFDKASFREFYFEFSDFQHAYAAGKGATLTNVPVTINGKAYTVKQAEIVPDSRFAINPPGAIENNNVMASPWLRVKPTLEGTADVCPTNTAMSFATTGCPETISTADIGTFSINYRNEPVAARVLDPTTLRQAPGAAGDLSLALSSTVVRADPRLNVQPTDTYPPLTADVKAGDPYTPMMRAYEGDRIRLKLQVGATEEGHNASLWATKWRQEHASPNSGWRNSQMMGISEQFDWDMATAVDPAAKGQGADYLFSPDNSVDGMWNGMWSLMRTYSQFRVKNALPNKTDLLALPSNRIDRKTATGQRNTVLNTADFQSKTQYLCPAGAPLVTMKVT